MAGDTKIRPDSGTATEGRQVLDHSGMAIGRAAADGIVVDHSGVRIGRVTSQS